MLGFKIENNDNVSTIYMLKDIKKLSYLNKRGEFYLYIVYIDNTTETIYEKDTDINLRDIYKSVCLIN